jgi:isochorismate synthase
MLDAALDPDQILGRLGRALRGVPAGSEGLVSVALPLAAMPAGARLAGPPGAIYWARPADGVRRMGVGMACSLEARGERRFARLEAARRRLAARWLALDPARCAGTPLAALGFGFSPEGTQGDPLGLGPARLWVPALLLRQEGSRRALVATAPWGAERGRAGARRRWLAAVGEALHALAEPEPAGAAAGAPEPLRERPEQAVWLARARRAVAALDRRELEKVVLTRAKDVRLGSAVDPGEVLAWLGQHYPGCTQFACRGAHATLLGATPERLVSLVGDRAVADAIAGTGARLAAPADGHRAGAALLEDRKLRVEHAVVVRDVAATLSPWCERLEVPRDPQLLTLPRLQHLWTPVHGTVRRGVSLLDLVGSLHPTPAVGGLPRREALAWLRREGEGGRGWYTGGTGWITPRGDGEVVVSLRCALLRGDAATLYAGAGFVAGSEPEQELAETDLKLMTMLAALGAA